MKLHASESVTAQTPDESFYDGLGIKPHTSSRTYVIAFIAAIGSLTWGYGQFCGSSTVSQPYFIAKFFTDPSTEAALIDGILGAFLGAGCIGALIQGPFSSRFGRKMTSATAAVMIAISAILMGAAPSLVCFYVGRIIGGLANGMVMTNIAVYMSEIAPAYSRGFVTGIVATFFGTGNIVAACIALGFSYLQNEIEWRGTYIILAALSVIMLASLFFIPESPRWLIEKGRDDEAWTVLQRIHRIKNDPDSKVAKAEHIQIRAQISAEKTLPRGWLYIMKNPHHRRRAFITFWMWFLANSTADFVIANLLPRYFASLGYDTTLQFGLSVAFPVTGVTACWFSAYLLDIVGRRKMIISGGVVSTLLITIVCILQSLYIDGSNLSGIRAAVGMTFVYEFFYCLFLEPATFNYCAELWPTHLRSYGVALSGLTFYVMQVAFSVPSATAFENIGSKYFIVFIGLCTFTTTVAYFTFPETKGLTLEEINSKFGDNVEIRFNDIRINDMGETHNESKGTSHLEREQDKFP